MPEPASNSEDDDYRDSDSFDCDVIYLDVPGDTTVRPCSPERAAFLKGLRDRETQLEAERAKMYGARQISPDNPSTAQDSK